MKKVVYVTGCCGFIGAYVTFQCLKEGWFVLGVDKMTYASNITHLLSFEEAYPDHFKFIRSDINDLTMLYDCDYVINVAAESHVDNSIVSSNEFLHSNINGVHRLLELIRKKDNYRMPTFLHFSTDETYGDIHEGAHTELDLLKPSNPYSATKAAADMLVTAWGRTFKLPYIIVRPTNNYGVGQHPEKLIPKACKMLMLGKKIPLHNHGLPKRVWLHARDTALAIVTIIRSNEDGKCNNQIYNISGNCEFSNMNVVKQIISHFKQEIVLDIENYCDFSYIREGQDLRYSLDDSKLRKLGWNNVCDFNIELPNIVKYYRDHFIW